MSQQEFMQPQRKEQEELDEVVTPATNAQNSEIDSLLDDIDSILETNASSFVQGFVQKGGE